MYYDDDYYYENQDGAGVGCLMFIFIFLLIIYVILAILAGSFAVGALVGLVVALSNYGKAVKMSLDNRPFSGLSNMDDGILQKIKSFMRRMKDISVRAHQLNCVKESEIRNAHSNDSRSIAVRSVKGAFYVGRVLSLIVGGVILNIALTLMGAMLGLLVIGLMLVARGVSYALGYVMGFIKEKYGGNTDDSL